MPIPLVHPLFHHRPARVVWWRRALAGPRRALLLAVLIALCAAAARAVEPPAPPYSVAVLRFADRRDGGAEHWLGRFLQERLSREIARTAKLGALEPTVGRLWSDTLGLTGDRPLTSADLARMGVQVAVQGTTQTVLALLEVRLHVSTRDGLLPVVPVRALLADTPPADLLQALLETLHATLKLPPPGEQPDSAAGWPDVERLYRVLLEMPATGLVDGRWRARVEREAEPGAPLRPRALEALAEADLRAAMLGTEAGGARQDLLRRALERLDAAIAAEPSAERHALRGEAYYLLGEGFQAKTEASVARLKNPADALAYTVLGLTAGLSTGRATEYMQEALRLNPFLWREERPEAAPAYQAGVLEPYFDRWDELRRERMATARGAEAYDDQVAQGIRLFEAGNYEDAAAVFGDAARHAPDDPTAELYQQRILLETGRAAEAVPNLQGLLARYPHDSELLYWFGRALEDTGSLVPAQEAYRQAAEEATDDPRPQRGLARVALAEAEPEAALEQVRALLDAHPDDAQGWVLLGRIDLALDRPGDAETAFRKALELEPALQDAREGLERLAGSSAQ